MDLKSILSDRIGAWDISLIVSSVYNNKELKQEIYSLIFASDNTIAYQAAWVFTHLPKNELKSFYSKQNVFIDELLNCKHAGRRRLLLKIISLQPQANPPRVDFLDYCLENTLSPSELPGVRTLCMKLAYELCREIPDLSMELQTILEMIEPELEPISIKTVRRNILKTISRE